MISKKALMDYVSDREPYEVKKFHSIGRKWDICDRCGTIIREGRPEWVIFHREGSTTLCLPCAIELSEEVS